MIKIPEKVTIKEKYGPAMEITSQTEANEYLDACINHCMLYGDVQTIPEAEAIEKENLGYFAGYYDEQTRMRVERLFKCSHPIFGRIENGSPSPEEAFRLGQELTKREETETTEIKEKRFDNPISVLDL